jgi:hypothetical protein
MLMHYFSYSGGLGANPTNSALGHVTQNLCFCIWWDLWVTKCVLLCPGRIMSMTYFSCSSGLAVIPLNACRDMLH